MNSHYFSIEHLYLTHPTLSGKNIFTDFNVVAKKVEIIALMGENGAGKTTLLRIIAGLQKFDSGEMYLAHRCLDNWQTHVPCHLRRVGLVFQDLVLFAHLTVYENVVIGLQKEKDSIKTKKFADIADFFEITELRTRYPHTLSGGQQQKVALARTLITQPDLLLLDEAFSKLDTAYKAQLLPRLRDLLIQHQQTTFFVTHQAQEADLLAMRTIML